MQRRLLQQLLPQLPLKGAERVTQSSQHVALLRCDFDVQSQHDVASRFCEPDML
jgi:hypothetical protein